MAPAASKFTRLPFNCHELGHTWTPSCTKASLDTGYHCFKEGLKIYTTCYVFSLLASRRYPKSYEEFCKVAKDIIRSSTFLTGNAVGYIAVFCVMQKLFGHHNFYTSGLIPAFIASYGAILVEKPNRRPLLALYVTNLASETIFRMLRSRGIVKNIKNFDFFLYIVSISMLLYQLKKKVGRNDFVDAILKKVVGAEEFDPPHHAFVMDETAAGASGGRNLRNRATDAERNEAILGQREVNNVGPGLLIGGPEIPVELPESNEAAEAGGEATGTNRTQQNLARILAARQNDESYRRRFIKFVLWMHRQVEDIACHLERMVAAVYDGRIHDTCPHKRPCFDYWFDGFGSRFLAGFGVQFVLETVAFLRRILARKSLNKKVDRVLPVYKCLKSGVGLGAFCMTFRLLSCSFRWLLGNEDSSHAIPSSVMATALGFILIRPPPTIGFYLLFKGLQSAISESHRQNNWKLIQWIDSVFGGGWCLLYALSTSVLLHAELFEPQNLKPSYHNFLTRITGGKLLEINRHLLTIYGTNSNFLVKHFWPKFDPRYTSSRMKELLKEVEVSAKLNGKNVVSQELIMKVILSK